MIDFFLRLFDPTEHPTSVGGGGLSGSIGWLHLLSDLSIFFCYTVLCGLLMVYLFRHRDLPHRKTIWLIAMFLLTAGVTRLVGGVMFYYPLFRLLLVVKMATAAIAFVAVFAVARIFPALVGLEPMARGRSKSTEAATGGKNAEAQLIEQRNQLEERATHLTVRDRRIRRALQSSGTAACSWDTESDEILWEVGLSELLGDADGSTESPRSLSRLLDESGRERLRRVAQTDGRSGQEFLVEFANSNFRGSDRSLIVRARMDSPLSSSMGKQIATGLFILPSPLASA